jgi:hypothetical protein
MAIKTRIRRRGVKRRGHARIKRASSSGTMAARQDLRSRSESDSGVLIGGAKDPAEKAADRMAAQALAGGPVSLGPSVATGQVQRRCTACEQEEVKRSAAPAGRVTAPGSHAAKASPNATTAIRSLGTGRALARSERAFFEPRFRRDLSKVRVHDSPGGDRAARAIDARAFTIGENIAFAKGERKKGGAALMAHELAHVVQGNGEARRMVRRACATCPTPVSPLVQVALTPNYKNGKPSGSKWGSTNLGTATVRSALVWNREQNTCVKCVAGGKKKDRWEICPRRILISANVDVMFDKAEINKVGPNRERYWMDCAPPRKTELITEAKARTTMKTPKRINVPGVIRHERYHVRATERLLINRIKARNDVLNLCPYRTLDIANWRAALKALLQKDAQSYLRSVPFEPNEESNANASECSGY